MSGIFASGRAIAGQGQADCDFTVREWRSWAEVGDADGAGGLLGSLGRRAADAAREVARARVCMVGGTRVCTGKCSAHRVIAETAARTTGSGVGT